MSITQIPKDSIRAEYPEAYEKVLIDPEIRTISVPNRLGFERELGTLLKTGNWMLVNSGMSVADSKLNVWWAILAKSNGALARQYSAYA